MLRFMPDKEIKRKDLLELSKTMDGPELAEHYGISRRTLYRLADREGVEVRKPKGGRPSRVRVVG